MVAMLFGVNWVDVGFFASNDDPLNSFQLVLIDRSDVEAGAFDIEFNYDQILWETGQASEGDANGLGGNSARAGYAYGQGEERVSLELPGSAVNGALLDGGPNALISDRLNSDLDGRYLFSARDGEIMVDPVEPPCRTSRRTSCRTSCRTSYPYSRYCNYSRTCFYLRFICFRCCRYFKTQKKQLAKVWLIANC